MNYRKSVDYATTILILLIILMVITSCTHTSRLQFDTAPNSSQALYNPISHEQRESVIVNPILLGAEMHPIKNDDPRLRLLQIKIAKWIKDSQIFSDVIIADKPYNGPGIVFNPKFSDELKQSASWYLYYYKENEKYSADFLVNVAVDGKVVNVFKYSEYDESITRSWILYALFPIFTLNSKDDGYSQSKVTRNIHQQFVPFLRNVGPSLSSSLGHREFSENVFEENAFEYKPIKRNFDHLIGFSASISAEYKPNDSPHLHESNDGPGFHIDYAYRPLNNYGSNYPDLFVPEVFARLSYAYLTHTVSPSTDSLGGDEWHETQKQLHIGGRLMFNASQHYRPYIGYSRILSRETHDLKSGIYVSQLNKSNWPLWRHSIEFGARYGHVLSKFQYDLGVEGYWKKGSSGFFRFRFGVLTNF